MKKILNFFKQSETICTACRKVFPLEHSMTCKQCDQHVCYKCFSIQDQDEKSRGWILCDRCAGGMY